MRRSSHVTIALLSISVWLGCGGGSTPKGPPTITLQSVTVTPGNTTVAAGLTQQFSAKANYSDGSSKDVSGSAAWSSSDTTFATVSSSGLATTLKQGSATITASLQSVNGTTDLTIDPAALTEITVTPGDASVVAGLTEQFSANGSYTDGISKDVSGSASWSSSDTTVATVSSSGLATTSKQGSATITASLQSVNGTSDLTISPAGLTKIAVTPNPAKVLAGATQQLTATASYTDGTSTDVSSKASWSSSFVGVSVSSSGLARGLVPGTALVQAAVGSISGEASLLVNTPYPRYAYASSFDGSISEYAIAANGGIASQGYVIQPSSPYFPPVAESTGKYLFSIVNFSNPPTPSIAAFQIGLDGHLTAAFGSPFAVSNSVGLSSLVAHPTANFLFGITQDGIVPYSIDLVYAVPTAGSVLPITSLAALAIDPLGRFLYALQPTNNAGNIFAFTINSDGTLSPVKNSPFQVEQPAFGDSGFKVDPTGRFLYELAVNGVTEYAINTQTGALASVGSLVAAGSNPVALAISPAGTELLVSNPLLPNDQVWLFNMDSSTGALSEISGSPVTLGSAQSLLGTSFDPSGQFVFAAEYPSFLETFSVTASTGLLTSVTKTLAKENAVPLVLGGDNALSYVPQFAYTTNTGSASVSAFSVNASTGSLTQLNNNTPYPVGSSALSLSVVPGVEVVVADGAAANIDYFPQNSDGTLGVEHSVPSQGIPVFPQPEPAGSVVDPSDRFLYVVDAFANGMEGYSTTPFSPLLPNSNFVSMGSVVPISAYFAGTIPAVTTIDPSGIYLLTVNQFKTTVDLFRVDSSLGGLIDDTPIQVPAISVLTGIAIDPSGLVVISSAFPGTAYIYTLDPVNQTLVGPTIIPLPFDQLNSVTINPANHAVYFPYSVSGNTGPGGVAGYILSNTNGLPNLTPISGTPFSADWSPAYISIAGSFAYVANFVSNDISLFNVNAASGALTFVGNTSLPLALGPVQVTVTGNFK